MRIRLFSRSFDRREESEHAGTKIKEFRLQISTERHSTLYNLYERSSLRIASVAYRSIFYIAWTPELSRLIKKFYPIQTPLYSNLSMKIRL